jgi:hypothetical protein
MEFTTDTAFLDEVVRTSQQVAAGQRSAFYRAVQSGELTRLASGVYLPTRVWDQLDADVHYLARLHAASVHLGDGRVHSHLSAAALWRLPMVDRWPTKSHVIAAHSSSGFVRAHHVIHSDGIPHSRDAIDGLEVTPLARTVVDVARTQLLSVAVAMADHALSIKPRGALSVYAETPTRDSLMMEAARHGSPRGSRKCEVALDLADGLSGSPGESVSRVAMHVLGVPPPALQQRFVDARGDMFADFWWEEFNLVGEFDGLGKYLRPEMLHGRTTAQAVVAEKKREDRIRALGPKVVRWDWPIARSLPQLEATLREAGLRW